MICEKILVRLRYDFEDDLCVWAMELGHQLHRQQTLSSFSVTSVWGAINQRGDKRGILEI